MSVDLATRITRPVLAALLCAAWSIGAPVAHAADDAPDPAVQDLVLLGPLQPVRMRLVIQIDGVPYRTAWQSAFDGLFDQFDRKHKGQVNAADANKLANLFQGTAGPQALSAAAMEAMAKDPDVTRAALQQRIEQDSPPFVVQFRLSSRGAGPALIPLLDIDGDQKLSRDELMRAEQSLHCRDFNDDQLITELELMAGPSAAGRDADAALDGPVIVRTPAIDAAKLAELLLSRYDRNRDGKLSCRTPAEVLLPDSEVAQLDTDADGALSRSELRRFADLPPNAELPFVLGRGSMGRARGTADAEYRLRRKLDGGYKLAIGSSEIDLRRNNRDPARSDDAPRFRDFDADSSGELDATEAANIPGAPAFSLVDADGDGKITSREFEEFFERRANAAAVQLVLEVSDQGHDLFTRLDVNFDRVLTPRELHTAARLLETEDADGDGFLGSTEVPYNLLLDLSRGGSRPNPNIVVTGMRIQSEPRVKVDRKGPAWFLKMDRNNDGDVGLPEFLGDRKTFERLDTDHDGLLSAEEAATVGAK